MRNPRITRLAFEQDGLITRGQALAAGVSPDAIRHALTVAHRWQTVVPGIYATFDGPLAQIHRLRAAVLFGGPASMITGSTACRLMDLRYVPGPSDEIDVLVDPRRHVADVGFIRAHRTIRMPRVTWWMDTASPGAAANHAVARPWWVEGDSLAPQARRWTIPIAPVARACIDAARLYHLSLIAAGALAPWPRRAVLRDVRGLLCEAVQRRHCTGEDLRIELSKAAWPGTAPARRAVEDIEVGCRLRPNVNCAILCVRVACYQNRAGTSRCRDTPVCSPMRAGQKLISS